MTRQRPIAPGCFSPLLFHLPDQRRTEHAESLLPRSFVRSSTNPLESSRNATGDKEELRDGVPVGEFDQSLAKRPHLFAHAAL